MRRRDGFTTRRWFVWMDSDAAARPIVVWAQTKTGAAVVTLRDFGARPVRVCPAPPIPNMAIRDAVASLTPQGHHYIDDGTGTACVRCGEPDVKHRSEVLGSDYRRP